MNIHTKDRLNLINGHNLEQLRIRDIAQKRLVDSQRDSKMVENDMRAKLGNSYMENEILASGLADAQDQVNTAMDMLDTASRVSRTTEMDLETKLTRSHLEKAVIYTSLIKVTDELEIMRTQYEADATKVDGLIQDNFNVVAELQQLSHKRRAPWTD
jgi:hypothetical protein